MAAPPKNVWGKFFNKSFVTERDMFEAFTSYYVRLIIRLSEESRGKFACSEPKEIKKETILTGDFAINDNSSNDNVESESVQPEERLDNSFSHRPENEFATPMDPRYNCVFNVEQLSPIFEYNGRLVREGTFHITFGCNMQLQLTGMLVVNSGVENFAFESWFEFTNQPFPSDFAPPAPPPQARLGTQSEPKQEFYDQDMPQQENFFQPPESHYQSDYFRPSSLEEVEPIQDEDTDERSLDYDHSPMIIDQGDGDSIPPSSTMALNAEEPFVPKPSQVPNFQCFIALQRSPSSPQVFSCIGSLPDFNLLDRLTNQSIYDRQFPTVTRLIALSTEYPNVHLRGDVISEVSSYSTYGYPIYGYANVFNRFPQLPPADWMFRGDFHYGQHVRSLSNAICYLRYDCDSFPGYFIEFCGKRYVSMETQFFFNNIKYLLGLNLGVEGLLIDDVEED